MNKNLEKLKQWLAEQEKEHPIEGFVCIVKSGDLGASIIHNLTISNLLAVCEDIRSQVKECVMQQLAEEIKATQNIKVGNE